MKLRFTLILFLLGFKIWAQDLIVEESKNAFYANGEKIEPNDVIQTGAKVNIRKKGNLSISYKNRWSLYLKTGVYNIDSAMRIELEKSEFKVHDSIYSILESKGLHSCKFRYRYEEILDSHVHGARIVDDIKLKNYKNLITITSDTASLAWTHPLQYGGRYYLLIMNIFEHYVTLIVTKDDHINLDLRPYKYYPGPAILYKVISEECRESNVQILKIE